MRYLYSDKLCVQRFTMEEADGRGWGVDSLVLK